jgi:ADP-ribose pyrophosphatase YjhB (NUDIX family)
MHPLEKFAYCPACGSKHFTINDFKSKHCLDCGFTYYANPCAATAAFILNDAGELLVVRRAKEPARGTLDLPGGFVDMGETVEEGMRREILEETGLRASHLQYLYSSPNVYEYSGMGIYTVDIDFLVTIHGDPAAVRAAVRAADDAAEALWMPLDEICPADFGLDSIRRAVEQFLLSKR